MKQYNVVLLSLIGLAGCRSPEEAPPPPLVDVKVARVEVADVGISVRAPAVIFGRQQANLNARVTAPIRRLLARKGDSVTAGQVLAELDDRDLVAQRDEAAAAVADAQANLARVAAATLPTDIARARGQLAVSEAALNQAQKFYDRRQELFRQGAIPQRELLVSQTELATARVNYEVARKSLDLLETQSKDQDIRMAKAKLEQTQAHLVLLQTQLGFTTIRAPFAGVMTDQFMFPGDMAKPDLPIFTVVDLAVAVARGQVPEAQAGALRPGQACAFTPADQPGASFEGRLTVVNQAVDPARRTIETWCEIPNPKHALRGGAFGALRAVTATAPKSMVVPLAAVQFVEGTRQGSVMIAGDKKTAGKREVETGEVFDGKVQVLSGLTAGELVIVEGGYGLPDGAHVRWQEEKAR